MDVINAHCISESREWANDRKFTPSQRYAPDINLNYVEIHDHDESSTYWTYIACEYADPCPCCGKAPPHLDCIVIAVDGACRRNGTTDARAAVGVFVGKVSEHNMRFPLTESKATNQIAELRAGILGLKQAISIRNKGVGGLKLQQVVIKADSEYLVKGMTELVFKWDKNGYRTSKGTKVTNAELFRKLENLVTELNGLEVEVLFWHVPRNCNKEADELANIALESS